MLFAAVPVDIQIAFTCVSNRSEKAPSTRALHASPS
jgi:hypothetical protein